MTIRAWQIVECGLKPEPADIPEPHVPQGCELVDVTAVSLTPLDVLIATGTSYFGTPAVPYVPGVQGVGRLGDGRRVWFTTDAGMRPGPGALAQKVAVPRSRMWEIPIDVPDEVVAGLGLSAVAAAGVLRRGRFCAGEDVLVLGAAGVVGRVAVQLARAWAAGRVVAACRGVHRVSDLGADAVVDITDLDEAAIADRFAQTMPDGVDLVVDPVWGAPAQAAVGVLRAGGRLVNLGDAAGSTACIPSALLRSRQAEILGYTNLSLTWDEQTSAMAEVLQLVAQSQLRFQAEVVDFDQAGLGWQRHVDGQAASRVVVRGS